MVASTKSLNKNPGVCEPLVGRRIRLLRESSSPLRWRVQVRNVRDDVNDTREVVSEPTDEVTCSYPCTLCHFGRDFGVDHKCHARLGQRGCLLGLFLCQSAVGGELGKYSARESIRASARGPILHTRGNFS